MRARARWMTLGAAMLAATSALARPSLRASLVAGYRAFRDPSLLDAHTEDRAPRAPPSTPNESACVRLAGDDRALDVDLRKSLALRQPGDLEDPESASVRELALPDLHVPITRRTMRVVRFLTRTDAGRSAFLVRYRRAAIYREAITFALREAGLPEDLLWLAAVESSFDPRAVSNAGAAGLWQMMPATAQLYGLEQTPFVDERRSIARATHAAVTHLRDLYERFGKWDLALAAYNAGYDRVAAAIERVAKGRGSDPAYVEFGDLASAHALPEETIQYVPQISAFAMVAANRARFGLDAPELGARALELGEIAVPEGTRLRTIARAAGVSIAVLRDYNPQLLRDRVPPIGGDYLVALPESRVQRALATFPSYSEQEVVARDDDGDRPNGDGVATDAVTAPLARASALDAEPGDDDDPLPRRPVPLGRNRLPELVAPARPTWMTGFGPGLLEAKLPASLAMPASWQRIALDGAQDPAPFALLARGYRAEVLEGTAVRDSAIEGQLGFLHPPSAAEAMRSFVLPNGVTVRVRRDPAAATASITVRVATVDEPADTGPLRLSRRGAEVGAAESLSTITVDKGDADAGIELGAARLRLLLGDTGATQEAEIRFRAGAARRRELSTTPYGSSWIALGDALFPPEHPLAGTVLGASEDEAALRDTAVAEALFREHASARASITVVGNVDEARARKLCESLLSFSKSAPGLGAARLVGPHPREDRLTIDDKVEAPRALVGWIGPAEGEVGDASLRVAFEILDGLKTKELTRAVVGDGSLASQAHATLELGARASVAAIEVTPAAGKDVAVALRALDAMLGRLADEGPDRNDVAIAKFILHARIAREQARDEARRAATSKRTFGEAHSPAVAELRHALRPWAAEKTLKALDEVTAATVQAAVRHVLSPAHRVVVVTAPRQR